MKRLFRPLFASHLAVAILAGVTAVALPHAFSDITVVCALAAILSVLSSLAVACWWSRRFTIAHATIERAIATGERPEGNSAFDVWATQLQVYIQHWIDSAANSRHGLREIEAVLTIVDQRIGSDSSRQGTTSQRLKSLLSGLGTDSAEILQQMVASHRDVDAYLKTAADSFEEQSSVLIVAEREAERIRQDTESNELKLCSVQESVSSTLVQVVEINDQLKESRRGIERIRHDVAAGESKVRLLREHTAEIAGLARSIGEVSARTDVLALNASIESVRASEDGRGFSVVAEEIRKLAAEITRTSRDILDHVEFLDTETSETNEIIACGRKSITSECDRTGHMLDLLAQVPASVEQIASDLHTFRAHDHLERASTVMTSMHRVGETCESHRAMVDEIRWKNQLFSKYISRLTDAVEPFLRSVKHGQKAHADEAEIPSDFGTALSDDRAAVDLVPVGQAI